MSSLLANLSFQAKSLPPQERAQLAEELLASLDPGEPGIEVAWDEELRRRIEQVERGAVKLTPADQVFSAARRAIGQ